MTEYQPRIIAIKCDVVWCECVLAKPNFGQQQLSSFINERKEMIVTKKKKKLFAQ